MQRIPTTLLTGRWRRAARRLYRTLLSMRWRRVARRLYRTLLPARLRHWIALVLALRLPGLRGLGVGTCAWLAINLPDRAVIEELIIRPR